MWQSSYYWNVLAGCASFHILTLRLECGIRDNHGLRIPTICNLALSVTTLPKFTHFYIADWTSVRPQAHMDIALPGSYSYDDTNKSFLPCSLKIALFLHAANSSGELLLAKGDTTLLRNIICQSTKVAILGDMLELGPTEFTFNELLLQFCCDAHFSVLSLGGTRFLTVAKNIYCVGEIKLVCINDAHYMTSEIINYVIRGDVILDNDSSQRQLGLILDLFNLISPTTLCCVMVSKNASTESSSLSLDCWKIRFIYAPILGSSYMSNVCQAAVQPNNFLISNMLLMMMEGAMILCGQRVLLKDPKIILLIESTIALATGLHRIVEETQVKYDPLHGKMLACCLMVSADIFPKVVNAVLTTISCHLDTVMIDHIFSYHRNYLRIDTIGGTSVTVLLTLFLTRTLRTRFLLRKGVLL
ncbi:uncharacterized protein LOC142173273 isoform X1 [Nicotiana tabacum]|uniref:Uncharacterized protein LOC142173273 isoform X1 n=1 Tax=Nicotiana tabacum TaxID=4097 RepID=A0AC58TB41_TOBAC